MFPLVQFDAVLEQVEVQSHGVKVSEWNPTSPLVPVLPPSSQLLDLPAAPHCQVSQGQRATRGAVGKVGERVPCPNVA